MFTVIKNNRALITIHIPPWAQKHEIFAAGELSKYLKKITKTEVGIKQSLSPIDKSAVVIADLSHPATSRLLPENIGEGLRCDGFRLKNIKAALYIVANEAAGVVAGVYDYLRRATGCAFLDHGEMGETIPQMDTISHPELDLVDNPDFWCRGMQLSCSFSLNDDPDKKELIRKKIDWMAKNGFSYLLIPFGDLWDNTKDFIIEEINKRGIKLEMGHHYFGNIAPESLYLQERPDLFPLQDNKRQPAGQLRYCIGNQDFIELASRKVIQEIADNPAIVIFDFWPDDFGATLCECKNCLKIDDPKDTEATDWKSLSHLRADRGIERRGDRRKMRRYLYLANQVAERVAAIYPKVKISVLAYLDLVDPPASKMVVHPNIIINLAIANAVLKLPKTAGLKVDILSVHMLPGNS